MPLTSAPAQRRRGIPEATVARLPVYHRVLSSLAERSVTVVSSEELAAAAGVNARQAAQGPLLPGLLRHPRRRLRRRLPRLPDRPRAGPDPGLAGRDRRRRQPRPRARQLRRLRLPWVPRRRRCSTPTRPRRRASVGGLAIRALDELEALVAEQRRRHRRHRHPGGGRPGGLRPAGRRRRHQHPELRPDRAHRARRVDVRKVDLSIELQILAFHEQRKLGAAAAASA